MDNGAISFKNIPNDHKRAQQLFEQKYKELEKKFAQLRMENKKLKARLSRKKVLSEVFVALCDKSGTVVVKTDGTVLVKGKAILPSLVANLVHEFVTKSSVKPAKSTLIAMTILSNKEAESVLRSAHAEGSSKPIPLSSILTAVRSTHPALRWAEVPNAEEYVVRVADKNDKVVWEGSAGTQTQVTLPLGFLKRGQVYSWQVEAVVEGQFVLSPAVGFWVLNEKELKELAMWVEAYNCIGGMRLNFGKIAQGIQEMEGAIRIYEDLICRIISFDFMLLHHLCKVIPLGKEQKQDDHPPILTPN